MDYFSFAPPARKVHTVFVHCSASDVPAHDDVAVMRDWHVKGNGWSDVGYHYYVKKNGAWQRGRSLEATPAAQGEGYNAGTIAICFGGLKREAFTEAQFRTGHVMLLTMVDAYGDRGIRLRIRGHREVYPKECPVFDYQRAFGLDGAGYMTQKPDFTVQGVTAPTGANVPGDLFLMVRNKAASVEALQLALKARGFYGDGEVDGDFGRKTWTALRAWQQANGLEVTGIAGAADRQALGIGA